MGTRLIRGRRPPGRGGDPNKKHQAGLGGQEGEPEQRRRPIRRAFHDPRLLATPPVRHHARNDESYGCGRIKVAVRPAVPSSRPRDPSTNTDRQLGRGHGDSNVSIDLNSPTPDRPLTTPTYGRDPMSSRSGLHVRYSWPWQPGQLVSTWLSGMPPPPPPRFSYRAEGGPWKFQGWHRAAAWLEKGKRGVFTNAQGWRTIFVFFRMQHELKIEGEKILRASGSLGARRSSRGRVFGRIDELRTTIQFKIFQKARHVLQSLSQEEFSKIGSVRLLLLLLLLLPRWIVRVPNMGIVERSIKPGPVVGTQRQPKP